MITTYTHRYVNPLNLRPEDICIEDIAHSLALTNRFAGHTPFPVSVGQHSVHVARLCPREHTLQGLLHDASEAYLGDVTKWIKAQPEFALYREVEERTQRMIYEKFGCSADQHPSVDEADKLMVRTEALFAYGPTMPLFERPDYPCPSEAELAGIIGGWKPWSWELAEEVFLFEFRRLTTGEDR